MTRRTIVVFVVVVLAGAIAAAIVLLRPVLRGDAAASPSTGHAEHDAQTSTAPQRGDVTIDSRVQQLIGVRTTAVRRTTLEPKIRATGTVAFDETRRVDVNTKVDGWIRELYVDYTGKAVRQGDPLFTLYSPDLLATENEFLLARRGLEHSAHSQVAGTREFSERLVDAARQRLLLWDVSPQYLADLERSGNATGVVTFRSPASGFIAEKTAVRGMRVMAGQTLYTIADISVVWVEANVYERELALVRVGQPATVTVESYPDARYAARAVYIHPTVDEQTRAARVRFQLSNRDGRLKPGMFANVEINAAAANVLVVAADALLDSGTEQIVFVAEGEGRFTPRRVRVGRRSGADVEVIEGLTEGETVASSAAFFLDSESQLRAGLQNYEPRNQEQAEPGTRNPAPGTQITFRSESDPPRTGENSFEVTVRDSSGNAIVDADVGVVLFMPAMPAMNMPAMRSEATLRPAGGGTYRGRGQVLMSGRWDVTVTVRRGGQPLGTAQFGLVAR